MWAHRIVYASSISKCQVNARFKAIHPIHTKYPFITNTFEYILYVRISGEKITTNLPAKKYNFMKFYEK